MFAYGTLMIPAVMHTVAGKKHAAKPAILTGHVRVRIPGEIYPGLIGCQYAVIQGRVI